MDTDDYWTCGLTRLGKVQLLKLCITQNLAEIKHQYLKTLRE